ncbi:hypothetical protein JY97_07750 [Alkalispirochaeta odontotermitis]|nr:hypothetical protein JY97_07750 [Alkalispirochaeta odontotermitis]CAB1079111.1 hypothetical protein D1AOALGA4SA_6827 [Olavius algarvensis Delta 1 endosymbiont]
MQRKYISAKKIFHFLCFGESYGAASALDLQGYIPISSLNHYFFDKIYFELHSKFSAYKWYKYC